MSLHRFTVRRSDQFELGNEIVRVDDERVIYEFVSKTTKQRLGIQLDSDGSIKVGTWDNSGDWIELDTPPLDQYDEG